MNIFSLWFQVIGLLDVFHSSKSINDFQHVYLVTHLMGADLNNIVKTQQLTDEHVQFLVYQILRGLKYIHSAGLIHRVGCIQFNKCHCLNICFMTNILYEQSPQTTFRNLLIIVTILIDL